MGSPAKTRATIIRRRHNGRFAALPNAIWEDDRLSVEAKGVLGYLLSRPHNWHVRLRQVAKKLNAGRDRLQRIFRELIAAGYVTREQGRDGGAYGAITYIVRDESLQSEEDDAAADLHTDQQNVAVLPQPEKAAPAQPQPENQAAYKEREELNTDFTKPLPQPLPRPVATGAGSPRARGERPEIIQNRIAQRIGADGWEVLGGLPAHRLDQLTAQERNGRLDEATLARIVLEARLPAPVRSVAK